MRPLARNKSRDRRFDSANQRWKSQWNTRLALSTIAAVAAHAVIFVAAPSWQVTLATSDSEQLELLRLAWAPAAEALSGLGAELPLATPVSDEPGPTPVQPGLEDGTAVGGGGLGESFESFRARLLSRSLPAPAIAESEPAPKRESPDDTPSTADEEPLVIGGRASLAGLPTSVDSSSLDLDRLSFRPARDNGVSVSRSVVFAVNFPW